MSLASSSSVVCASGKPPSADRYAITLFSRGVAFAKNEQNAASARERRKALQHSFEMQSLPEKENLMIKARWRCSWRITCRPSEASDMTCAATNQKKKPFKETLQFL